MVVLSKAATAAFVATLAGSASATNLFKCNLDDFYKGFDKNDFSSASALRAALHEYIDGHVVIPYDKTDEAMSVMDKSPVGQGVTCVYSQLPKHPFPDDWNREHIWPRSLGLGDHGPDHSDLHALHPSDVNLNSARGNKIFDECAKGSSGCESPAGTSTEFAGAGSSETTNAWAPPDVFKGDAARAVFYMATRYNGDEANTEKLQIKECGSQSECGANAIGRLSTLLKWHREDPVSDVERRRNNAICSDYQGNRNPFVDFPELVELVYGAGQAIEVVPEEEGEKDEGKKGMDLMQYALVSLLIGFVAGFVIVLRKASRAKNSSSAVKEVEL